MNDYIYEFKDLPSTDTPLNAETFTAMQNKLLNSIYPIGSVIIKDDDIDYSNYLGFTWEKSFIGKFLVGVDENDNDEASLSFRYVGKTGGEKLHTLTINEMPSHNHSFSYKWKIANVGSTDWAAQNTDASGQLTNVIGYTGGSQPHNNLPPYQVVAYWKRVA